MCIIVTCR